MNDDISCTTIHNILSTYFTKGYRLKSGIEKRRFYNSYREIIGKDFPNSIDIDDIISSCGLICDGRVFAPDAMLPTNLRQEIYNFISDTFAEGKSYIYYEYLYNHFQKDLLSTEIVRASRLRICLQHYYSRDWLFAEDYIAKNRDVVVSIDNIVVEYVRECGKIVKEDEVVKALYHLPEAKVRSAFNTNRNVLISATRKSKFHIDLFEITQKELEQICYIIDNSIENFSYITSEELITNIKNSIPKLIENNSEIPKWGIFKALKAILLTKYSFNITVICRLGQKLSPEDILTSFAKTHEQFTTKEISALAIQLAASLDYQLKNIYRYAIRINNDTFVAKDNIKFDVPAVDIAIEKCLENKHTFLPLAKITNFISFPQMEYVWNQRLLESFLTACSNSRYGMSYSGYMREGSICGVIINKSHCEGMKFDDILVQALAESKLSLENSDDALDFCVREGYIVNRRYKSIDIILNKARKAQEENIK